MNQKNKKKNSTNKILIISAIVLAVVIFGLTISKSELLSNGRLSRLLRASITGKENYKISDKRDALVVTANAYYDRDKNIQYDASRRTYTKDPEESTSQEINYVNGTSFIYSVYKKALGIDIMPTGERLMSYADEMNDTDYVVATYTQQELDSFSTTNQLLAALKSDLEIGDIVLYQRTAIDSHSATTNDIYHPMLVTDTSQNVSVIQALGVNTFTRNEQNTDEEEITGLSNTYYNGTTYEDISLDSTNPRAVTKKFTLYDMLNKYNGAIKKVVVIRPLGSDGSQFDSLENGVQEINVTDQAKARLEYPNIKISKTSHQGDNSTVNIGESITYNIHIENNGSTIGNLDVTENVSGPVEIINTNPQATVTGKTIKWNINSIESNGAKSLSYTVRINKDISVLNSKITSTGDVDGINTGTVIHKVQNTLTNDQIQSFRNNYISHSKNSLITAESAALGYEIIDEDVFDFHSIINSNKYLEMVPNNMFRLKEDDIGKGNLMLSDLEDEYDNYKNPGLTLLDLIDGDLIITEEYTYAYSDNKLYKFSRYGTSSEETIDQADVNKILNNIYKYREYVIIRPSIVTPALIKITANNKNIIVGSSKEISVNVPTSISVSEPTVSLSTNSSAVCSVQGQSVVGNSVGTCTVTAALANGKTDELTFEVKNSLNTDATLNKIKVYKYNNTTVSEDLVYTMSDPNSLTYTSPENEKLYYTHLDVIPTSNTTDYSIVSVNGQAYSSSDFGYISLKPGENTIVIKLTAEDGEHERTYTVTITREYTDSNKLSSLIVGGSDLYTNTGEVTEFNPLLNSYRAKVTTDSLEGYSVPIYATPQLVGATVNIVRPETLVYGDNTFTINVQGVSTAVNTYTVIVNIAEPISSDATLRGIKVNNIDVGILNEASNETEFDPDVSEYYVTIPENQCEITISYTKAKNSQNVEVIAPSNATCTSRILEYNLHVTAEDGVTTKTYTVYVLRSITANAKLQSLLVSAIDSNNQIVEYEFENGFNPDVFEYYVTIPFEIDELNITATPVDSYASVYLTGSTAIDVGSDNTLGVVVSVPDGENDVVSTYTIHITREGSTDNKLSRLYIEGYSINPNFNSDINAYTATVPNNVDSIYVGAEYDSTNYIEVTGDGLHNLTVGQNEINVVCTPPGGTPNTYTITVTRLDDINIDGIVFDGDMVIIDEETTVSNLKTTASEYGDISVLDHNKNTKSDTSLVATSDYLRIGSADYEIALLGDFNGDGYVDDGDVYDLFIYTFNMIFNPESVTSLTPVKEKAGDFNKDTSLDDGDVYDLFIYTFNKLFE